MKVAVLLTTFNRRATTLRGLRSLHEQLSQVPDIDFTVFMVDDASTDGTAAAVAESWPGVIVGKGSGDLFWGGGMRAAFELALASATPWDAFLLFNDDVEVVCDLRPFFDLFNRAAFDALAGATVASAPPHQITYSGFERLGRARPFTFRRVTLDGLYARADTFNCNFVLVRSSTMVGLGGIDRHFSHLGGDLDLGLRITEAGGQVGVFGSPIGICDMGTPFDVRIAQMGFGDRLRSCFRHPYGLGQDLYFAYRHGNRWLLPLYFLKYVTRRLSIVLFPRSIRRRSSAELASSFASSGGPV